MRAGQPHRQVVHAEVHAGRAGREGHIGPVVHQHGHVERRDQRARERHLLPRGRRLEPELHRGRAAGFGGAGEGDDVAAGHQAVVGDEPSAESMPLH